MDEYPTEPFTEVYWIKFQKINSARYCVYTLTLVLVSAEMLLAKTCTKLVLNKMCSAKSSKKRNPFISGILRLAVYLIAGSLLQL